MKIAQVSPLFESVPPRFYGGTERIVSYLTEELVRRGHEVTLFASGDSRTSAGLVAPVPRALRMDPGVRDWIPYHVMLLEEVRLRADEFDAIHFHTDLLHMPLARELRGRALTTLHGRLNLPDLTPFYHAFPDAALVSISDDQRRPMPPVDWLGTVHHGLPLDLLPFSPDARGGYLAFLGRISPEKRPDRAIEIATRAGWPLRIAAKVDRADHEYWTDEIRPMIERAPNVEFIGEIGDADKARFLGDAAAVLFPIDWPEPFGLVMIEAMACGTPVIAFDCGSVPEVIEPGVTGYVVRSIDEAVRAIGELGRLERAGVRRAFEERFSVARMARDYERIYDLLPGTRTKLMPVLRPDDRSGLLPAVA
ncbi:MAG TPA: glycosyltransferase family 4 protein [Paracoccaceae bacterium]|nr:glycosyltransferase family 4 protein [Paracoccaceae bacterium]